jgi:hypothetical protein
VAVVKVPDTRLAILDEIYHPRRVVAAEVEYSDLPRLAARQEERPRTGAAAAATAQAPAYLAQLRNVDALLHVVAGFEEVDVEDLPAAMVARLGEGAAELVLADLIVVENRLERLQAEIRKLPTAERAVRESEESALRRVHERLDDGGVARDLELSVEEQRLLRGFGLLTAKPTLIVANLDERTWPARQTVESALASSHVHLATGVVSLMAEWEAELAELEPEEAAAFRESLGLTEPAANRVLAEMYRVAGLVSFLTVGEDEVRAWPVPPAPSPLKPRARCIPTFSAPSFAPRSFPTRTTCASVLGRRPAVPAPSGRSAKTTPCRTATSFTSWPDVERAGVRPDAEARSAKVEGQWPAASCWALLLPFQRPPETIRLSSSSASKAACSSTAPAAPTRSCCEPASSPPR